MFISKPRRAVLPHFGGPHWAWKLNIACPCDYSRPRCLLSIRSIRRGFLLISYTQCAPTAYVTALTPIPNGVWLPIGFYMVINPSEKWQWPAISHFKFCYLFMFYLLFVLHAVALTPSESGISLFCLHSPCMLFSLSLLGWRWEFKCFFTRLSFKAYNLNSAYLFRSLSPAIFKAPFFS